MKKAALAIATTLFAAAAAANPSGWITVLVPLNPGVIAGAGTQWTTTLWASNTSGQTFNIDCRYGFVEPPPPPCDQLKAHSTQKIDYPYYPGYDYETDHPGFFLRVLSTFINPVPSDALDFTLSVSAGGFDSGGPGTDIPLVTPDAFRNALALPRVPDNGRSRLRLRVYGMADGEVTVRAVGLLTNIEAWHTTLSLKGVTDKVPSYAELDLSGFPRTDVAYRIELTSPVKVWGFMSITDNVTQQFTTVAPAQGEYIVRSDA
jgi:hypothetical protein